MSNSMFQAYTDYMTTVNNMVYNNMMTYTKTTQEFVTEVIKANPYKDVFGVMESFAEKASVKKTK
jgi:hypothetical protein